MSTSLKEELDARVGQNILFYRNARSMSQELLGSLVGLHQTAISRVENGNQLLSPGEFYIISQILNVPMRFLFLTADEREDLVVPDNSDSNTKKDPAA